MPEQAILEFVGDPSGLKPVADALTALGQLTEKQQKDFAKANDDFKKRMQESANATKVAASSVEKLSTGAKELSKTFAGAAIKDATKDLNKFSTELVTAGKQATSLKGRLREIKAELATIDDEGSPAFQKLAIEAAQLEDKIGDVSERIRVLASDTFAIDAVVDGVRGLTAAFTIAQSASALFGKENEDLQKALLKVQAASGLLMGVQEIANQLTGQGAAKLAVLSAAQKVYAFAVGTSVGVMKAFRIALLGTGIGALIFLLYEGAKAFGVFDDAVDKDTENLNKNTQAVALNSEEREKAIIDQAKLLAQQSLGIAGIEKLRNAVKELDQANLEALKTELEAGLVFQQRQAANEKDLKFKKVFNDEVKKYEERLSLVNAQLDLFAVKTDKATDANKKLADELPTEMLELMRDGQLAQLEAEEKFRLKQIELAQAGADEAIRIKEEEVAERLRLDDIIEENAKKNEEAITAKQKEEEEKRKAQRIEITQAAFQAIGMIVSEAFAQQQQQIQDTLNAQLDALNTQMEVTLANESLTASEREQIQAQFAEKEKQAKKAAWIADQNAKAEQALINGLLAFTTSLATQGVPAGLITGAIGLALAGVEAALIKSKPVPQFGEGGLIEGNAHSHGGVNINAEGGEYVFSKKAVKGIGITNLEKMNEYASMVPSIPADMLNQFEQNRTSTIDYGRLGKEFAKELGKNPMLSVSIDRNGVNLLIKKGNRSMNYLNNKFRN